MHADMKIHIKNMLACTTYIHIDMFVCIRICMYVMSGTVEFGGAKNCVSCAQCVFNTFDRSLAFFETLIGKGGGDMRWRRGAIFHDSLKLA